MLELRNIHKTYHVCGVETVALDGISVTFRKNEFVAILGTSGSGKTTCLNIIGGHIPAKMASQKDAVEALRSE